MTAKKTLFTVATASLLLTHLAIADTYDEPTPPQPTTSAAATIQEDITGQSPSLTTNVLSGQGVSSASYTSPNAYGSGYSAFVSLNRISYWTGTDVDGGALSVGGNVGDPHRYIGATIALNVQPLDFSGNFVGNGSGTVRINRYFGDSTAIALGVGNIYGWGEFSHGSHNYYAALTHTFPLSMPLTLNGGIGTGAFDSSADFSAETDKNISPFFSVGLGVLYNLSVLADYTSRQFSLGANYMFRFLNIPFVANAGVVNILSNNGGSANFQCGIGAAYVFKA